MTSTISALTTGGGGIVMSGDSSGNLSLLSGATTVVAVTSTGASVTGTLAVSGGVTLTTTLPVLQGGTGVTTKTGTGNVVLSASPTITGTGSILASSIGGNVTQSNIVTSGPAGSTSAGVFTDTGASLSLVAGTYLINTTGNISMSAQSGTNVAFRYAWLALTDSSNTVIYSNIGSGSYAYGFTTIPMSFVLTVASTTTYKTRFTSQNNSGSPTISSMELLCNSYWPITHSIIAIRLT